MSVMSEDKSEDTTDAEVEVEADTHIEAKTKAEAQTRADAQTAAKPEPKAEDVLARPLRAGDEDKTFGEVTLDDARAMAADLKAKVGWGPTAKVATIARGWDELGRVMNQREVATVAELDGETVIEFARKVWVLPPYDQMLF